MSKTTCENGECEAESYARGFCQKHYDADRYQRLGEAARKRATEHRANHPDEVKEYLAAYYLAHQDRLKEAAKAWSRANPERKKAVDAAWNERNRAHKNARDRARWNADLARGKAAHADWYRRNKHKAKEASHRRRAIKYGVGYERVDLKLLLAEYGMVCHICTKPIATRSDLHFDHVIPLAKGGVHAASNIRPAHAKCNLSKGARILTT